MLITLPSRRIDDTSAVPLLTLAELLLESLGPQGVGLPYPTFQNLPIGFHGCHLVIGGRSERDAFTPICPTHQKKGS